MGTDFNMFNPGMDYTPPQTGWGGYSAEFNAFNPVMTQSSPPVDTFKSSVSLTSPTKAVLDTFKSAEDILPEDKSRIDDVLHLSDKIDTSLKQRYPNGCKIVGIGRSPSLMLEIFKAKGYEVATCPISGLMTGEYDISGQGKCPWLKQLDTNDVKKYGENLKEIGISADDIAKSSKPVVFVDYTRTGNSLRGFSELIGRREIGITKNVAFLSLNKDLIQNPSISEMRMIDDLWENTKIKNYSFTPRVMVSELGEVKNIVKSFRPSEAASKFLAQAVKVLKMVR